MEELMLALLLWIGANSDYQIHDVELPGIEFRTKAELYRIAGAKGPRTVWAIYDDENRKILLHDGFNPNAAEDRARMAHELVHHLQVVSGKEFPCMQASEPEAYRIHKLWLEQHGLPYTGPDKEEVAMMSLCFRDRDD